MKKFFFTSCLFATLFSFYGCDQNLSHFQKYKNPHILTQARQKMLTLELKGDPNETASKAFSILYKIYYKLDDPKNGVENQFPRARWPISADLPRNEWVGIFGIPVSDKIEQLPQDYESMNPPVKIEYWEYGTIAQILHIGTYAQEKPTIDKLVRFIKSHNLTITGVHEEIYLKSRGMFFKGDENKYQTLILYPVEKTNVKE
ncbi:MAG: GyrI-like domain-containing protein [Leptospiraceae bacterium]|nr:GyrI-like domain-containing protein [Leptospiraceae bacterium]MCP5495347.1 GyrI-like domain-containing protein [Leptospiraceae bacterium]